MRSGEIDEKMNNISGNGSFIYFWYQICNAIKEELGKNKAVKLYMFNARIIPSNCSVSPCFCIINNFSFEGWLSFFEIWKLCTQMEFLIQFVFYPKTLFPVCLIILFYSLFFIFFYEDSNVWRCNDEEYYQFHGNYFAARYDFRFFVYCHSSQGG